MVRSLRSPGHLALMRVLVETRKARGLTQQAVADRMDRPQSYMAKIENGERRLDVVELAEWAIAVEADAGTVARAVVEVVRDAGTSSA